MNNEISWYVELSLVHNKLALFKELTNRMVEMSLEEDGTVIYERHICEETSTVHIYERYINSEAALLHLQLFAELFGDEFARLIKRDNFVVFGDPSNELRSSLSSYGARFTSYLGGFSR